MNPNTKLFAITLIVCSLIGCSSGAMAPTETAKMLTKPVPNQISTRFETVVGQLENARNPDERKSLYGQNVTLLRMLEASRDPNMAGLQSRFRRLMNQR